MHSLPATNTDRCPMRTLLAAPPSEKARRLYQTDNHWSYFVAQSCPHRQHAATRPPGTAATTPADTTDRPLLPRPSCSRRSFKRCSES